MFAPFIAPAADRKPVLRIAKIVNATIRLSGTDTLGCALTTAIAASLQSKAERSQSNTLQAVESLGKRIFRQTQ